MTTRKSQSTRALVQVLGTLFAVTLLLLQQLLGVGTTQAASGDIYVSGFGATAGDTTDDTTAIQNALNSAASNNRARVIFNAGRYITSQTLTINDTDGLTLEGAIDGTGKPATVMFEYVQYSGGTSGFAVFSARRNTNFAIKNFVAQVDKPAAFFGRIVDVTNTSVTIEPLTSNYTLPVSYTETRNNIPVIDLDGSVAYRTVSLGGDKLFANVSGTNRLRVTGLTARPNLFVGEAVGWEIIRLYGQGIANIIDGSNVTVQNLQAKNWVGTPVQPYRVGGTLVLKDIYAVPTSEYYNSAMGGPCICGNPADITVDNFQYFSVAAEDTGMLGTDLYTVTAIDTVAKRVTYSSFAQASTWERAAGETASFYLNITDGVPDATATVVQADGSSFTFASLPAGLKVGDTFLLERFRPKSLLLKNSQTNGRFYILDNAIVQNSTGTHYGFHTLEQRGEGGYPQSVEVVGNTIYGTGITQSLLNSNRTGSPMKSLSVRNNLFFGSTVSVSVDHVNGVTVANNSTDIKTTLVSSGSYALNVSESGTTRLMAESSVSALTNGDFGSGSLSPWTQTVGSGASVTTETGSARLTLPAGYQVVSVNITGLSPNTAYTFSGKVKDATYTTWAKVAGFADVANTWSRSLNIGGDYTLFSIGFKTMNKTTATLQFIRTGGSANAYIDDLSVRRLLAPPPPPLDTTYLSDLNWSSATIGWGTIGKDVSVSNTTLTVNGTTYAKGLGTHANSEIVYAIGGQGYTRFKASVGIDDVVTSSGTVVFQVWLDNVKVYDSGVQNTSGAPQAVDVDVTGKSTLKLVVTDAGDGIGADHGNWGNARLTKDSPPPTTTTYVSDLSWISAVNGWGPVEKDKSNGENNANDGTTIMLNGVTYAKGLGVAPSNTANSDVRYTLTGLGYSRFLSDVGVDDEVGTNGSVVFQVYLDGVLAYDSGTMTGASTTKAIDLNVAGKNELRLVVTNAGDGNAYDHADWAGARLTN